MDTCEKCAYLDINSVTELASKSKKAGICEMRECLVSTKGKPCKNYTERN